MLGSLRRGQPGEHVPTRRAVSGGSEGLEDLLWREDAIAVHAKQLEMEDLLLMGRFAPLRIEEVEIEVREVEPPHCPGSDPLSSFSQDYLHLLLSGQQQEK